MNFNFLTTLRIEDNLLLMFFTVVSSVTVFYFANWAEYHTGELVTCSYGFGVIEIENLFIFIYCMTGVLGSDIWLYDVYNGIQLNFIIIFTCMVFVILLSLPVIYNAFLKSKSLEIFFKSIFSVFSLFFCYFIIFFYGNFKNCYISLFFTCNFFFNINCCKLIVFSMSKMRFEAFHKELILFYVFTFLLVFVENENFGNFLINFMFFLGLGLLVNFGYRVSIQISGALNINILTVD